MPAKTRFVLFVTSAITCCFVVVTSEDAGLDASVNMLTGRLPHNATEAPKAGNNTVRTCPPSPRTENNSFMGDASLLTQLAFWFGTTGLIVTVCITLAYFCCCSCGHRKTRRRQDDAVSMLREPLLPPQPSGGPDPWERRSSVRPLILSTQTRSGPGISSTSVTYATVYPRQDRAAAGSSTGSRSGVGRGAQSPGVFHVMSPALESHNSEVQDYGYQRQRLNPYYTGLPAYSAAARSVSVDNGQPQIAPPQHQEATGVRRSPPPPYPYDHCQE